MEKKSNFLTFFASLIPGVGYMYLGLMKKGIQTLVLFLVIKHFFPLIGMGFLNSIILVPFWFYTFFDTFNTAGKINRGEHVSDVGFVFQKQNGDEIHSSNLVGDKGFFEILAWVFIVFGVLAITNRMLESSTIYHLTVSYFKVYFLPTLLIGGGIYMLIKENREKKR